MKLNLIARAKSSLNDKLATFKWFERFLSIFCVFIPVILRLTDKGAGGNLCSGWRSSISDYVYMGHSCVFGLLLGTASLLFIFNGMVYLKEEDKGALNLDRSGKWYNVVLGLCLLGVLVLPWRQHVYPHFFFAGAFFMGNAIVTIVVHQKTLAKIKYCHGHTNCCCTWALFYQTISMADPVLGGMGFVGSRWRSFLSGGT